LSDLRFEVYILGEAKLLPDLAFDNEFPLPSPFAGLESTP